MTATVIAALVACVVIVAVFVIAAQMDARDQRRAPPMPEKPYQYRRKS